MSLGQEYATCTPVMDHQRTEWPSEWLPPISTEQSTHISVWSAGVAKKNGMELFSALNLSGGDVSCLFSPPIWRILWGCTCSYEMLFHPLFFLHCWKAHVHASINIRASFYLFTPNCIEPPLVGEGKGGWVTYQHSTFYAKLPVLFWCLMVEDVLLLLLLLLNASLHLNQK